MRTGRCFVVGAGDVTPRGLVLRPDDMLIAADGGLDALIPLGLRPHCLVGDMDSLQGRGAGLPTLRFPIRKDDTDLALAVALGRRMGYERFLLYGASGGQREDHFMAALQLMGGLSQQGLRLSLIAPAFIIHSVHQAQMLFRCRRGATVSVFSHSGRSLGVRLKGLSFDAEGLSLHSGHPLGVSNQALHNRFSVSVQQGVLLVYIAEDPGQAISR